MNKQEKKQTLITQMNTLPIETLLDIFDIDVYSIAEDIITNDMDEHHIDATIAEIQELDN